jgi:hypothetical protein
LKPEKTASSKKRKAQSILFTEIDLTTSSDDTTSEEYLFTSSKPFSTSKTKLENNLTQQSTTELVLSLIVNNEEHLLRVLADTCARSIILEAYTSALFIKIDDNNTTTWSTTGVGSQVTTTKSWIYL